MFNRNPTVETTVAYPWAKVFFGFVGGMILCNFLANSVENIRVIIDILMQASLARAEMDEFALSVLLYFFFPFSVSSP